MNSAIRNNTRPPAILETERLLLRAPRLEDALDLSELAAADPSFARSTVGDADNNSLESACTAIVRMLEDRRQGLGSWWVVAEKASGRAIGLVGFSDRNPEAGLVSALSADCIGCGYLAESLEAIANYGMSTAYARSSSDSALAADSKHETRDSDVRWYWRSKAVRSHAALNRRCA